MTWDRSRWSRHIGGEPAAQRPHAPPFVLGVLDGEGIGPEVVEASLQVLSAVEVEGRRFEIRRAGAIGHPAEASDATSLSADIAAFCAEVFSSGGAILAGAVGGRFVYDLRKRFDLFCKIVPLRVSDELIEDNRLKRNFLEGVDIVVVRENTGGVYQGEWGFEESDEGRRAVHSFAYSQQRVSRIVEAATRIAAARRGKLLVVVKDGGLPSISELWRECATSAARAAGIRCSFVNIDLAAYLLIQQAHELDVVVAPNLFGDVLADLGGVLLGSRALSFSGNFSAHREAVYQTNHGAAFDLAGSNRANPAGQIFALAMALRESFNLDLEAARIEQAVAEVWRAGWRTADMAGGRQRVVGCREMADLVCQALSKDL
jgi:3-isopropylmalate dehydrogenase